MGKLLRIVLTALAMGATISAAAATLWEPFWEELFRRAGIDSSRWVSPMLMLLGQEWVQLIAAGVVGAAIGSWAHWAAIRFDRQRAIHIGSTADRPASVLDVLAAVFVGNPDEQIRDLESHNKDLQERLERAESTANPHRMEAFAYLNPPDRKQLIVQWRSPIRDLNAAVALDYQASGEPSKRLVLQDTIRVVHGQTIETLVCKVSDDGTWVWATPENKIVHRGRVMCRLVAMASNGSEYYWRFGIADRDFKEEPRVVGEDVFEYAFS